MKIVKEGDKGQIICETCGLTTTTYRRHDVPFSDSRGTVKNILVGVCDICQQVVSIPPQSTPEIKARFNAM